MTTTLTATLPVERRANVIWVAVALGLVLAAGALAHSYNLFGYPLYLGDEGIYMARAYAVVKLGWLTPYTYWYDHAPAGWLLLAAWAVLTGGFNTFGTAINGGRVLMLLLHLVSLVFLFRIVLRLTASILAASITGLIYALSPLVLTYGRMVLLDNMMIFWILLAAVLLLQHEGKLWPILFSGFCFGIAGLTKEIAIFMLPAFVYGLWRLPQKNHANFARAVWLYGALGTLSLYPLYAALRKELIDFSLFYPLAGGVASGEGSISLLGAVVWQLGRSGGAPWEPAGDFFHLLTTNWLLKDPWLLGLGLLATVWNIFNPDTSRRMIALLALAAFLSIAHGNPAFEFYIIVVTPFLAINVGLALFDLGSRTRQQSLLSMAAVAVVALSWSNLSQQRDIFDLDLTTIQRQALAWVQEHVPPGAQLMTDDDLWVDLRGGQPGQPRFPGTHSHWQVANDPAVYRDLFHEDWKLIDYLVLTPGLEEVLARSPNSLAYQAYENSTPVASFSVGNAEVEIRKVNHPGIVVKEMLSQSYESFKARYIEDGQVHPEGGYTQAVDQAGAMLMAVWMDDKATFDALWAWTAMYLQSENGLLYHTNQPGAEAHTMTEADTDAALALLLAEKRWDNAGYGRQARRIINAIWENEVVVIRGKPYLAAGDWAVGKKEVIFAPAAFSPHAYHFFAEADPDHNWWYLLDTNYKLLAQVSQAGPEEENSTGLLPTYVGLNRWTGALLPEPAGVPAGANTFGPQAAQVYWRVGLDAQWHDDERPDDFLTTSRFLVQQWQAEDRLAASYSLSGEPLTEQESLVVYSAVLPQFLLADPQAAHEMFATRLAANFSQTDNEGQWGDGNLAEERWAWLATGLYAGLLSYQWDTEYSTDY